MTAVNVSGRCYSRLRHDADSQRRQRGEGRTLGYDIHGRLETISALTDEAPDTHLYDPLDILAKKNDEQRFYQDGQLSNLIQGANSSTFMRGNSEVLAERKGGANPKS